MHVKPHYETSRLESKQIVALLKLSTKDFRRLLCGEAVDRIDLKFKNNLSAADFKKGNGFKAWFNRTAETVKFLLGYLWASLCGILKSDAAAKTNPSDSAKSETTNVTFGEFKLSGDKALVEALRPEIEKRKSLLHLSDTDFMNLKALRNLPNGKVQIIAEGKASHPYRLAQTTLSVSRPNNEIVEVDLSTQHFAMDNQSETPTITTSRNIQIKNISEVKFFSALITSKSDTKERMEQLSQFIEVQGSDDTPPIHDIHHFKEAKQAGWINALPPVYYRKTVSSGSIIEDMLPPNSSHAYRRTKITNQDGTETIHLEQYDPQKGFPNAADHEAGQTEFDYANDKTLVDGNNRTYTLIRHLNTDKVKGVLTRTAATYGPPEDRTQKWPAYTGTLTVNGKPVQLNNEHLGRRKTDIPEDIASEIETAFEPLVFSEPETVLKRQ